MFMEPGRSLKPHIFAFSHNSSASHRLFGVFCFGVSGTTTKSHSHLGLSQRGKGNFSRAFMGLLISRNFNWSGRFNLSSSYLGLATFPLPGATQYQSVMDRRCKKDTGRSRHKSLLSSTEVNNSWDINLLSPSSLPQTCLSCKQGGDFVVVHLEML